LNSFLRSISLIVLALWIAGAASASATHSPENEQSLEAEASEQMTLDELLTAFASMEGLEAEFVEEKHISMLAAPMESRGTLYFSPPGYLLRRIDEPRNVDVLVTPTELRVSEEGETVESFDLRSREDVAHFVESFVWILAGNRDALSEAYELRFEHSKNEGEGWTLRLIPNNERLGQILQSIVVEGTNLEVEKITVTESSGDRTITRILEANPHRTFSSEEERALFGEQTE
jgi:outer membrane lipoprotein-sorting protein